ERPLPHHTVEDLRAELAPNVLVELDAVQLEEVALLRLQIALELLERDLLAVDLCGVAGAREVEIDAPENERDGYEAENDNDDRTAESVAYSLQHGSPRKAWDCRLPRLDARGGAPLLVDD